MLEKFIFQENIVKQNIHEASIINKHPVHMLICYVHSYNHGIIMQILDSLDVGLGESDSFVNFFGFLLLTGTASYRPTNDSTKVAWTRMIYKFFQPQGWLRQA